VRIFQGKCDDKGEKTLFGQLFQQGKSNVDIFRKNKSSDSKPFKVKLVGEGSQDIGGVFREIMDLICCEVESHSLPLCIKTQNNKNLIGTNREKYTFNPSSTSLIQIQMFEFLGVIMGMALRTSHILSLNFPSYIWKQIIGDPLDKNDLKGYDSFCVQVINRKKDFILFSVWMISEI
jgi:E3 ubiquitin-protein ligase HERC2